MPTYWGVDYTDLLVNQPDVTRVDIPTGSVSSNQVMNDTLITKGRYRLTVRNPVGPVFTNEPIPTEALVTTEDGTIVSKAITVDMIRVDVESNKAFIDITVHDNPIPLIALYGAVFVVCAIAGALSATSVLESVETILEKPISWLIVILVGFIVLAPFIGKRT